MKCPVCKIDTLNSVKLDENLQAYRCGRCQGHWIKSFQYWKWLNTQADQTNNMPETEVIPLPVKDSKEAKICIECGHFLIRNKVGHGLNFYLDKCANCGGIWLDKNEWETLKSHNLHDDILLVFSASWQADNRQQELEKVNKETIMSRIGEETYNSILNFCSWLNQHDHKDDIQEYLFNYIKSREYTFENKLSSEDLNYLKEIKYWLKHNSNKNIITPYLKDFFFKKSTLEDLELEQNDMEKIEAIKQLLQTNKHKSEILALIEECHGYN